jgi:hypothetical protein
VYESTHKFRLLNVRIEGAAHDTFIAELRTRVYQMSVYQVQAALIAYEQGRLLQQALLRAAGGSNTYQTNPYGGRGGRGGRGYRGGSTVVVSVDLDKKSLTLPVAVSATFRPQISRL